MISDPKYILTNETRRLKSEDNLSQDGACWVYDDACVYDDALIENQAVIREEAIIFGNARVCDSASVRDQACVKGSALIFDSGSIQGRATVKDRASVRDHGIVTGDIILGGVAQIKGDCCFGNFADSYLKFSTVDGPVRFSHTPTRYIILGPIGENGVYITFYTTVDGRIWAESGYFSGTINDFEGNLTKIYEDPIDKRYFKQYMIAIRTARDMFS